MYASLNYLAAMAAWTLLATTASSRRPVERAMAAISPNPLGFLVQE